MSWVGFDFDGTVSRLSDGLPVSSIVEKIKHFRSQGVEVRICTARISSKQTPEHIVNHTKYIQDWCKVYIGEVLPVTAEKDYEMVILYDDRAIAVKTDAGECLGWNQTVEVTV